MSVETPAAPGRQPDPDKLNAFVGKMLGDLGAVALRRTLI